MKLVEGGGIAIAGNTVHFSTDSTNNMNFTVTASSPSNPNMTIANSNSSSDSNNNSNDGGNSNSNQTAIKATTATFTDPKPLSEDLTWGYAAIYDGMNNQFNNTNDGYSSTNQTIQANNKYAGLTTTPTAIAKGNDLNSSTTKTIQAHYAARINDVSKLKSGNYSTSIVYTLTAEEIVPPPTITSISPSYVPLKTSNTFLTITGTNLATTSRVFIDFNKDKIADNNETCVTQYIANTTVTCLAPSYATAGTYTVYLTTDSGVAASAVTYVDAMQSMTTAMCNSLTTPDASATAIDETGEYLGNSSYVQQRTLMDARDNKTYKIRKLADGNCWMVENLALGTTSLSGLTLTDQDTDLNRQTSWTLPVYNNVGDTWDNDTDDAHIVQGSAAADGNWQQGMGNWYTWGAATADTAKNAITSGAIATDSICPAGWQLPSDTGIKSFRNLITTRYSIDNSSTGSTKLQSDPLSFTYSGSYGNYSGAVYGVGSGGDYWSSGANYGDKAYDLHFYSNGINSQNPYSRGGGLSVRCVAR